MNRTLTTSALACLLAVLTAACGPTYGPGPDGIITDRDRASYKHTGWRYWLTVTAPNGHTTQFRVTRDDYGRCFRGSHYPACTRRSTP